MLRTSGRLTLLLAVLLGIVTMHALVGESTATTVPVAATPTASHAQQPEHVDMSLLDGARMTTVTSAIAAAPGPMQASPTAPMPMPMPTSSHDLMHLCLAVLVALVVLLTRLLLRSQVRLPETAPAPVTHSVDPTPRRPPPGHAVRQAELCVLRN
jgi:hypothetical protein